MQTHWLIRIYLAALKLFPAAYRKAYGEELAYAIRAQVAEARAKGGPALAGLVWRELRDLPGALLEAHLAWEANAMFANSERPKWFFYLGWVLASVVSLPIAGVIGFVVIGLTTMVVGGRIMVDGVSHITEDYLATWLQFPLLGLVTGVLQYFMLRRYLARCGWWIVAAALGWTLPFVLSFAFFAAFPGASLGLRPSPALAVATLALLGSLAALPQWWLLRRRVRLASWWPIAAFLGWGMVGLAVGPTFDTGLDVAALVLIPGAATALALWLLLGRPHPATPVEPLSPGR
jgi:hypothetical protein